LAVLCWLIRPVALCVFALCAFAASAQGGTVVYTDAGLDPAVVFVDDSKALSAGTVNDVTVTSADASWIFTDPGGIATRTDAENLCTEASRKTVVCPMGSITGIDLFLGPQDDRVKLPQTPGFQKAWVFLGEGDDSLRAGPESASVSDGAGDDIVRLGAGVDFVSTDGGRNLVEGGSGDDHLLSFGRHGSTSLSGGGGTDNLAIRGDRDTAQGGPGTDFLFSRKVAGASLAGGAGSDVLFSEGGTTGSCGGGTDFIFPGVNDLVSTDCEVVSYEFNCASVCAGRLTVTGKTKTGTEVVVASERFKLRDGSELPEAKLRDSAVARLLRDQHRAPVTQTVSYTEDGDRRNEEDSYFLNDKRRNIKAPSPLGRQP
jgi:hypothetical protein